MSDELALATDAPHPPERIAEVSHLANLLAERVLAEHMADRAVPDAHIHALAQAAQLLAEYGQDVPPLMVPIMDQLRAGVAAQAGGEPANEA